MQPNQPATGQLKTVRGAFTLVELLMVIAIIGILIGMLIVAVGPVITTSREFAVTTELKQMDLAIESFNTKYGFYPPSFAGFTSGAAPGLELQVLPYLNNISPNHQELQPMFSTVGSPTRLRLWWLSIGRRLDDRGSLILWLSGLSANKQFPLTAGLTPLDNAGMPNPAGPVAQIPIIFNSDRATRVDAAGNDTVAMAEHDIVGAIERDVLFDFRGGQISTTFFNYTLTPPQIDTMPPPGIRVYNMPSGNERADIAYYYRNAGFYNLNPAATASNDPASAARMSDAHYVRVNNPSGGITGQIFLNPRTFQLTTFGLDGVAVASPINKTSDVPNFNLNNDNITNFATGRLDTFDWSEAVDLGGRGAE